MTSGSRLPLVFLFVSLVWLGAASPGVGQLPVDLELPALPGERTSYEVVYRPPSAEYRIQRGDRFDLIYQTGTEDMTRRTRAILQSSWAGTDSLVGPVASDFHTPVVINGYNDRGNGFVEPLPFRQEIEAVSSKTDQLVARSSTWPSLVAPHELVHSAHGDVHAGVGIGGLVRLFAPDWTRALNLTAPRGLVEGVAVYRESQVESGAGRLHAPLFTMKMKAAILSDDPWSFTQLLEAPAYTQPFNRHYIAGGHTFQYLVERGDTTSTEFFRDAVTWHNRFPYLGFGVWLGASTDQFPHQLKTEIRTRLREKYAAKLNRRRPFTPVSLVASEAGLNHRRPYWLDDETLVAYVYGYDVRAGFYRIDVSTGRRTPIRIQSLTEDRTYSLSLDTTALYASRYVTPPLVPTQELAEVERVSLASGTASQLTERGRALAPVKGPSGRVHAVTNNGPFTRWSVIEEDGTSRPLTPDTATSVRQIAPAPGEGPIAVLVNRNGNQRIYRARLSGTGPPEIEPWLGLKGAVVYDLCWGPEGQFLLFAADHPRTANVFAFDTKTQRVLQLANVPFGAIEPALSPDRSTVAFVNYRHERHDLVTIPFRPDSASVVPDSMVELGGPSPRASLPPAPGPSGEKGSRSYVAWRHLAPRMVFPTLHSVEDDLSSVNPTEEGALGVGVGLAGVDPLKRWAYRGSAYWQDGALWGEARLESAQFLLRPSLAVYDRPARVSGTQPGIEERGVGLGVRLPIVLRSNVYQSFLQFEVETELQQIRLYEGGLPQPTPFSTRLTLTPSAVFGYRLQQNIRDLVPNTGVAVGMLGAFDPWVDAGPLRIGARSGVRSVLSVYLPFLRGTHTGIRLGGSLLTQDGPAFGTSTFVPRGYDSLGALPGVSRSSGTFLRLDAEVTQPLWYIDGGLSLLPVYAKVLSAYGFGQTLGRVADGGWREVATSVGAGLSLRTRFFYIFDLDLRVGTAYRFGPNDVEPVYR